MREIKFRAWDKKFKVMHYQVEDTYDTSPEKKKQYMGNSFGDLISFSEEGKFGLMQYTGLTDKQGKEIYEGDVVRFFHNYVNDIPNIGKIVFENCSYIIACNEIPDSWMHLLEIEQNCLDIEVIGNIYEHPEMLK